VKAVVITPHGGPDVLEIRNVSAPLPGGEEEELVHVESGAINFADT
jgi:hypothetical protein